jgi:hypothetical protein
MVSTKQKEASKKNIKKAQQKWKSMSHKEHSLAQPEGDNRAKPGTEGGGEYYRVEVRPKDQFVTFRYHDVGKPGGVQRLAGKRSSGTWDDHAWLIEKKMAHVEGDILVADDSDAKEVLDKIGPAKLLKGDIFEGHPIKNVPEKDKPTLLQTRARMKNIEKAHEARW